MGGNYMVWGLLLAAASLLASQPAEALSNAKCQSFVSTSTNTVRGIKNQCATLASQAVDYGACVNFANKATASQNILVSVYNKARTDYSACAKKYRTAIVNIANAIKADISYCHSLYNERCQQSTPVTPVTSGGDASACEECTITCEALCSSCAEVNDCSSQYVASCISCGSNPYCCG